MRRGNKIRPSLVFLGRHPSHDVVETRLCVHVPTQIGMLAACDQVITKIVARRRIQVTFLDLYGQLTEGLLPMMRLQKFVPWLFLSLLMLPLSFSFGSYANASEKRVVKVGVYQNEPGVFKNDKGEIKGFYIDLLKHTADKEGWELDYVFGTWTDSLHKLAKGNIDLLVAIAHTRKRTERYDFNQETAFSNWGQVYVWNSKLDAIPKLKDKIIAGATDDIYFLRFKALLAQFGLPFEAQEQPDYESVLQAVADNDADAGVIPRSAGMKIEDDFDVFVSSMLCCPMEIRYATRKDHNAELLTALDRNLFELKEDNESFYYQSFSKWFEDKKAKPFPKWVLWTLAGGAGIVVLLFTGNLLLRRQVQARTVDLEKEIVIRKQAEEGMRKAMRNLLALHVAPGVIWLQVPEAELYILCGCPGEVVKHLMRRGFISNTSKNGVPFETGPNVILLSDVLIQNGGFANLAEFPVLQMLYRQGLILPNHPNNTGSKPMLIGSKTQVRAQMDYIYRGNYGLISKEEMMDACGLDEKTADIMMRIKLKFAFGAIRSPANFLDTLEVEEKPLEIRNGVTVARSGFNRYTFSFQGESTEVDLNLPADVPYESPYPLGRHNLQQQHFAVIHTGEGDGWDINRPSMGSVVMFKGRIYLIDASPGILQSLSALGIDISEVEGIFQTHAHDDHFAGLPALIQTDRRLKYFATPLVRASVTKKFAALMSLSEEKFSRFFQIQDLAFDQWLDCDGLEVMPLYSPHPLETTLFLFRAMDTEGTKKYQTYAHWADLSAFKVLDGMVGDGPKDVPADFMEGIKKDYLRPATLKKLDIGGGMIHGMAEDFRQDASKRLILAHIARQLTTEEMEIGSEASFGAQDVLIAGETDYRIERAFQFLQEFFPGAPAKAIRELMDCPVLDYNAGTIILRGRRTDDCPDFLDMILSGTVAYLNSEAKLRNHLAFGSFIGGEVLFDEQEEIQPAPNVSKAESHIPAEGDRRAAQSKNGVGERRMWTYRTVSHCSVLHFSIPKMRAFLEDNNLLGQLQAVMAKVGFLRRTWLFGEHTTFLSLGRIARSMERVVLQANSYLDMTTAPLLWLVVEGRVAFVDSAGHTLETVRKGGFLGENTYLAPDTEWKFKAENNDVVLYRVQLDNLLEIPIIHWKLLEVFEKRRNEKRREKISF